MPDAAQAYMLAASDHLRRKLEAMAPREDTESDRLLDQARKWALEDDPPKTVRELFGIRTTPDAERALDLYRQGAQQVIAYGSHRCGKTYEVGAGIFGHEWYAKGAVLAEDDRPRGSLLVLLANKEKQVVGTSWKTIRDLSEKAERNGHPIIGAQTMPPKGVGWQADPRQPLRWGIIVQSFRVRSKANAKPVLSAEAGIHHPHGVLVWIEEFDEMRPEMMNTVRGWGIRKALACFNPYDDDPRVRAALEGGEWEIARFSKLRYPPVVDRGGPIPGGANHLELERDMRNPSLWHRLGTQQEVEELNRDRKPEKRIPMAARHHKLYALPPPGMPDVAERRADGVPGHPKADPVWFEPGNIAAAGDLGEFPFESENLVMPPSTWRRAEQRWRELRAPTWDPRATGVDTAEGGPDRFCACDNYGRSAAEIWERYQKALESHEHEEALALAERCDACAGTGCEVCWDGRLPFYLSRPRVIPKDPDGEIMAPRIMQPHGAATLYRLDSGGGGYYLAAPLQRRGCKVEGIHFGLSGADLPQIPGQRAYLNNRARMYGAIAAVAAIGGAAFPPADLGHVETEMRQGFCILEWVKVKLKAGTFWKLPDKTDVSIALTIGSPDPSDAAASIEGHCKTVAPQFVEFSLR